MVFQRSAEKGIIDLKQHRLGSSGVEQGSEEARVGGSIPSLAANLVNLV